MRSLSVTRVSTLSRFVFRNPGLSISALFLLAAVSLALIGPVAGTGDPNVINGDATFGSPSGEFLLGNDHLGRSVLARLVSALRISLLLATLSGLLAALAGTVVGVTVGYYGGLLDELVMRFVDMLFAFPWLLMAILVAAALGTGTQSVVVAIVIVMFPSFSRIVRGPTLSVREREYVTAALVIGASPVRILFRHLVPNVFAPILIQLSYTISVALILEGSLSFLGVGVQPPTATLGSLMRDGKLYMERAPWTVIFAGTTLALAIIAINIIGDWLRDFLDPKVRRLLR